MKNNFWIVLLTGFTFFSCNSGVEEALTVGKARKILFAADSSYSSSWLLVETHDPYNGGVTQKADSTFPPRFILFSDGHFLNYDHSNTTEGEWFLHESKDKLALIAHRYNQTEIPLKSRDTLFRYNIIHQSEDSLVLGIQGRHGIVEMCYRANSGK